MPVEGQPGKFIHYKGMRNLDATIDYALAELGLKEASELVVTGGSAGGLSTFLHLDHIAERMAAEAPECKRTTGAPVVGFFLDHATYAGSVAYPTSGNYSDWMKIVVADQNVKGALLPECLKAFPDREHLCFMSPHMARFIQTPFFVFNSRFDVSPTLLRSSLLAAFPGLYGPECNWESDQMRGSPIAPDRFYRYCHCCAHFFQTLLNARDYC